jgi:hypothetical protein
MSPSPRGLHRQHPQPAGHVAVAGHQDLAVEHVADRLEPHRPPREVRRVLRLADVAAGERAVGQEPGEPACGVEHGDHVDAVAGHRQPDPAHRVLLGRAHRTRPHDVADPQLHVRQELRRLRAGALERPRRLRVHLPEPGRHVLVVAVEAAAQLGVADRRPDRVEVGIAVPRHEDRGH